MAGTHFDNRNPETQTQTQNKLKLKREVGPGWV
jgi:hypothetical protein